MGIPVSGKNLFPSNIAGLPTWYTIRANWQGYVGRKKEVDYLVAMNPETAREDVLTLAAGAAVLYDEPLKLNTLRDDVVFYPVPFDRIVAEFCKDAKLRRLVKNMIYDGVLSKLLNIDLGQMEHALRKQMGKKLKAIELNLAALEAGSKYAADHLGKQDPFWIEPMEETHGMILVEGNAAAAFGCMMAGVTVCAWYPITPSSSLPETLIQLMKKHRHDADGKATYAIIQAEDEIASIGMVVGAGWAGARAMTSTSGPGISLMSEFAGMAYFSEIPAVIWDIQRMGPSTGLPTRVSQGDVLKAYYLGHGDTRHVCLLPGNMQECFEFGYKAFDLAERLQTPVFVLSDLDLGMNNWMTDPFEYPAEPLDRGKVLDAEQLKQFETWGRYMDIDGDGIPYRTLPGNPNARAAYLTRGTGHNEFGIYSERPADWQHNLDRLTRKHNAARTLVPAPVADEVDGATIGIIAYGSADFGVQEGRDRLRAQGVETSYLRMRALPLGEATRDFVAKYDRVYVVELNQDGQMHQLIQLHLPEYAMKLRSVRNCNGLPLSARFVVESILEAERGV